MIYHGDFELTLCFGILFLILYLVINQDMVLLYRTFHAFCLLLQCSLLSCGGDAKDKHITVLMNAGLLVSNIFITFHGIIIIAVFVLL
jgi:hypothetical protein